jgi:hypothetical protein
MLRHYLCTHALGAKRIVLSADNCAAQNKNQFTVALLCILVMLGAYEEVALHFMIRGHTKFGPDGTIGRIKKVYSRSQCFTISEAAAVIRRCQAECEVLGASFFRDYRSLIKKYFVKCTGIQSWHYVRVSRQDPTLVYWKTSGEGQDETELRVTRPNFDRAAFLADLESLGPAPDIKPVELWKRWHWYTKVRPTLPDQYQEEYAPRPTEGDPSLARDVPVFREA